MVGKVSDSGLTGILQLFDGLQYRLSSLLLPLLSPQSSIFVPGNGYGSIAFVTPCNKNRLVHLIRSVNSFNRYSELFSRMRLIK